MKKLLLIIALVIIVAGGIYQYMRINTYSYHLDKAEAALDRIDEALSGTSPSSVTLIPTVYAQNGGLDESAIAKDADTAVNEIGEAQNSINDISDEAERTDAQGELNETRDHAESTLDTASKAVYSENVKDSIEDAQNELADIKPGKEYNNDNIANIDDPNYDPNNDPIMEADRITDDDEDDDGYFDDDDEEVIEDERPIDEAERVNTHDDSVANNDYDADYDAAEKAAMERYQPLLDWKGDTPVPLEGDKGVLGDTAEIINDDGSQETIQAEVEEGLADLSGSSFDMEAMQEAVDKMMEQ